MPELIIASLDRGSVGASRSLEHIFGSLCDNIGLEKRFKTEQIKADLTGITGDDSQKLITVKLKDHSPIEIRLDASGKNLEMKYDDDSNNAREFAVEVLTRLKKAPKGYELTNEADFEHKSFLIIVAYLDKALGPNIPGTPLGQTRRGTSGAEVEFGDEEVSPGEVEEGLGIISNFPGDAHLNTGIRQSSAEQGIGFESLNREALRAGLSSSEALAAGLQNNPPGSHLDLGDSSYSPFLENRIWKLSRDEDTDTLKAMKLTAFRDIEPEGWESAKAAFIDTLTELQNGNCGTMADALDPGKVAAYKKSYDREGKAFFENMEIPSKDPGNEFTVRGIDPQTKQGYVTQVKYDPVSRSVEQVFPRSEGTDSSNFAPSDKQLLVAFEMLRNVGLHSKGKEFTIAGTTNTDLIIKCIQLGNSLNLVPKMSEKVQEAMLKKIGENMDDFKSFGGSTPQEVLESIKGSSYQGILPYGMPIDSGKGPGHRNKPR